MLHQILDHTNQPAPLMDRPRHANRAYEVLLGAYQADATGENRLGFDGMAVNGFIITGCEAHAAVRMHVTPATGSPWSPDRKGKSVATAPSAGTLRT